MQGHWKQTDHEMRRISVQNKIFVDAKTPRNPRKFEPHENYYPYGILYSGAAFTYLRQLTACCLNLNKHTLLVFNYSPVVRILKLVSCLLAGEGRRNLRFTVLSFVMSTLFVADLTVYIPGIQLNIYILSTPVISRH